MQIRLPAPNADELAHSLQLQRRIADSIRAGGPIPFSQYMQDCLYTPGLGYYSAGATKFGAAGDFVTAPELGSLFAGCLAETIRPCLQRLGAEAQVLELGGGSGALAADLLQALVEAGSVPARYRLLEPSADLRERQRSHLQARLPAAVFDRVEWLDHLPDQGWRGVLVANEVIDALPASRFVIDGERVGEEYVELAAPAGFRRCDRPATPALTQAVRQLEDALGQRFEDGYRSEWRPQLAPWLASVCGQLQAGMAVWIDYGFPASEYYLPERRDGTLMAYFRHRAHDDPFHLPGLDDLTASVDFSALAAAAVAAGLSVEVYASQAGWLLASGLQPRFEARYVETDDPRRQWALAQQVRKLTMPEHMGERFGVMLLARGDTAGYGLERWAEVDRRYRL